MSATAVAAPKRITGKLDESGYTVIALASNGEAASDQASRGKFALRPPARRVTLHLREADGTYGGPVVADREGRRRTIMGLQAGAELGRVDVKPSKGYAKVSSNLPNDAIDEDLVARAKNGVPIGAGNFGRVRSKPPRNPVAGDRDLDGVPTSLDIDDDGDLILDDVDASTGRAPRATSAPAEAPRFSPLTGLILGGPSGNFLFAPIVNANAPGVDAGDINESLRALGTLKIDGITFASAELDCAGDPTAVPPRPGLVYCSAGGTGSAAGEPFPACCDSDGDGFGSLRTGPWPGLGGVLRHGAGADEIRAGDPLLVRDSDGPGEALGTVATVFATVPAIRSYVDEHGIEHFVSYPVTPDFDQPGTHLPVVDGPDAGSDVSVKLNFWRPQRRPVPDELPPGGGNWIDVGGLHHYGQPDPTGRPCPESSYSQLDPGLDPVPPGSPGLPPDASYRMFDTVTDQAADPNSTFSYTLNLSQCLAFSGQQFQPGDVRKVGFFGVRPPDSAGSFSFAEAFYVFRHDQP